MKKKKKNRNKKNKTNKQKNLNLFYFDNFALIITILRRKLVRQIFWFPKYILYLH